MTLPHKIRDWIMFRWPISLLLARPDRIGIEFPYKGDHVIWSWPWRRKGKPKYISINFSGTGEFGDARFKTLKELDKEWDEYFKAWEGIELISSGKMMPDKPLNINELRDIVMKPRNNP